jgi:predicted CoA-binding protein
MDTGKFLKKGNAIAVVGASANTVKWGYRIYRTLKGTFPRVYAVNPKYNEIMGDRCYTELKSLPERPDVVITVVPPEITKKVVEACRELGIRRVWMQPGSESPDAIEFCRKNRMECVHHACFVVDGLKKKLV